MKAHYTEEELAKIKANLPRFQRFCTAGCNLDEIAELFCLTRPEILSIFGGATRVDKAALDRAGLEPVYPPGSPGKTNLWRCRDGDRWFAWITGVRPVAPGAEDPFAVFEAAWALGMLRRM